MSIRILTGDCREAMRTLPEASVDAIVTDPPYHLTTGKKGGTGPASVNLESPYGRARIGTGFMGMTWDGGDVAFDPATWAECLRVLKPGGYLLAFGGTRTYHRLACAIEDAGFEIRDQIGWAFGAGFPKSHNLDRERGNAICGCEQTTEQSVHGLFDSDVPPPASAGGRRGEVLQQGVPEQGAHRAVPRPEPGKGITRPVQSSLEGWGDAAPPARQLRAGALREGAGMGAADGPEGRLRDGASADDGAVVRLPADAGGSGASRRPRPAAQPAAEPRTVAGQPEPQARGAWPVCGGCGKPILPKGLGTALKPAWEPICMARKPLTGTVAANVLAHGTGALNIDGCRIGTNARTYSGMSSARPAVGVFRDDAWTPRAIEVSVTGRWPANLIHDGSDEVLAAFPDAPGQIADASSSSSSRKTQNVYGAMKRGNGRDGEPSADSANDGAVGFNMKPGARRGDAGSAARFFYCAKASREDRNEGTEGVMSWASEDHNRAEDVLLQLRRVTSDAMTLFRDDSAWSTTSCGSATTDRFRQAIKSIIETTTRPTTQSATSNCSPPWSTSDCIRAATEAAMANGSSLAELAEFTSRSKASSTSEATASVLDAVHAVLEMLSSASAKGRGGNFHATVKPTDLMRYLCRLVTPKGGTVLDPFMGSGSTLKAAELEGFSAIGIELNPEYAEIARRRIAADAPLFAEVL